MQKERQPSEIIQEFVDLMDKSHVEYLEAKKQVDAFNGRTYQWTHDLEDCRNKQDRNKLATAWQKELRERRKQKDRLKLYEKIHVFSSDVANKAFLKKLKHLTLEQQRAEQYVNTPYEEREYKAKGGAYRNDNNT